MHVQQSFTPVKISSKGQVVIPAPIRRRYGWEMGTRVVVESITPTKITLRKKQPRRKKSLAEKYWGAFKDELFSTKQYLADKKKEIEYEDRDIWKKK